MNFASINFRSRAIHPVMDSSVVTSVPFATGLKVQLWTAFIPRESPVQPMRFIGSTCCRVEVMPIPAPFHRKIVPGAEVLPISPKPHLAFVLELLNCPYYSV